MRALLCGLFAIAAVGCGAAATNPCKGVAGTCVSLTVQSSTVATVDSLHILASGALTGDQTSSGGRANLPIVVALKLPANTAGSLDLHVDGFLTATLVGSCDTDTLVTPGQHATALCTLMNADTGGADMATGGGDDLAGTGPDMMALPCDPKGVAGPQCVWRWQTPLPQGDDLKAVVAFTDSDTYALTVDGTILHRDATAWTTMAAKPAAATLSSTDTMFTFGGNSMDIFIGGTGSSGGTTIPLVFHSPDRGLTWAQETLPGAATGFVGNGATTGGAAILPANASNGNVYVRNSGTGAWGTVATNNASASYYDVAMTFLYSVVVGSVSGTSAAIAYSVNDGAAWTAVPTANITPAAANVALYGVCFGAGATNGWWAVGGSVIIHASGNTPSAWAQQGSTATAGASLQGCVATDSMHAWAFGANGAVLVTSDGGTTWAGVTTPPATTQTLESGAHSSGAALTLVGTKGVIFRSTNGGSSFAAEQTGPQDRLTAAFGPAPQTVFAIGDNGAIYTTSNDGATWAKLAIPAASGTTATLTGVWGASATDVYAVGASGTIVHSTNGTTFTKYAGSNAPPASTSFNDVWGSAALGVFAVGTDGAYPNLTRVVYRTTDQGATWAPVTITGFTGGTPAGTNALFTTFALGSDVWVAGDSGNVYHSTDGTTFTQQNTGVTNLGVLRMRGISGLVIATLGNDPGSYISSTNSGVTWMSPTTGVWGSQGYQIAITPDESAIYMFMTSSPPQVSYDKLATWPALTTVMNPNVVRGGFAFAGNDVFVVGDTGIIHYGN